MMPISELVELAAFEGVRVTLKIDGERDQDKGRPWTVILGSPHFGESPARRGDFTQLTSAIGWAQGTMAGLPGDWSWLGDHVDADDLRDVFEDLGRQGFVALLDYDGGTWSLNVIGSIYANFPTFDECLLEGLGLLRGRA